MSFSFQTVSSHGASNPIVARLSLQTSELLRWLGSDKDVQQRVTELYTRVLQPRLLSCYDSLIAIETKLTDSAEYVDRARRNDPSSKEIPYVEALDTDVQSFLVDAKTFLRDLIGIFEIVENYKKLKKNGKPASNEGSDFADYSGMAKV